MGFNTYFKTDAVFVMPLQTLSICWYIIHLFIVASHSHFGDAFLECSFSKKRELINLGS